MMSAIDTSSAGLAEPVPAFGTALAAHDARLAQLAQDVLEVLHRDVLRAGDLLSLERAAVVVGGFREQDRGSHRVVDLRRDTHWVILAYRRGLGLRTVSAVAGSSLPADQRPVDPTPVHTTDLPPTPTRDRNIPATAWIEAPAQLLGSRRRHRGAGRDVQAPARPMVALAGGPGIPSRCPISGDRRRRPPAAVQLPPLRRRLG